jgi:4-oxalmesaconate hydratase
VIIDVHAHLVTPLSILGIRAALQVSGGQHSLEWIKQNHLSPDDLTKAVENNIAIMNKVGTDMQFLSPRPFSLMHSHQRVADVKTWVSLQNDLIHANIEKYPTRFRGIAALPQANGHPIEIVFDELNRCINELGFVGVLVNPDPSEGLGNSPTIGESYWYPLWERLVELDIPALIHSAGCCGRETYDEHFATEESLAITSIAHSEVFERFPALKLIIAHGGGAIPYQIGRWRSHWLVTQAGKKPHLARYLKAAEAAGWAGEPLPPRPDDLTTFDDILRKFYFDTVLHDTDAMEHLFRKVGVDRCLFGTERPGSGGGLDLATGRPMDDFKYKIDRMTSLSAEDRTALYSGNALKIFNRVPKEVPGQRS